MIKDFSYEIRPPGENTSRLIAGPFSEFTRPGSIYATPCWKSLEDLVQFFARGIVSQYPESEKKAVSYGWPTIEEWIKTRTIRDGYHGRVTPETTIVTPTPLSFIRNKQATFLEANFTNRKKPLTPDDAVSFLTVSRMDSTGRPNYGQILTLGTLYLKEFCYPMTFTYLTLKQKKRVGTVGIEDLINESKQNWEDLTRIALKFTYRGGLPSLGKSSH